jgi:hypothetical protein
MTEAASQDKTAKAKTAPVVAPDEPDLSAQAADLEQQLAKVRAEAAGQDMVSLKVEDPHAAFIHNGITVGTDFTPVPASAVAAMMEAATDSGVTLTQEAS